MKVERREVYQSIRENYKCLIIAVFFISFILFLIPRNAAADSGSIPFFKINGVFSDPYSLQYMTSKYFDIPQSQLTNTFLPGEKIDFTVDYIAIAP
jgi:hypothetical protein